MFDLQPPRHISTLHKAAKRQWGGMSAAREGRHFPGATVPVSTPSRPVEGKSPARRYSGASGRWAGCAWGVEFPSRSRGKRRSQVAALVTLREVRHIGLAAARAIGLRCQHSITQRVVT